MTVIASMRNLGPASAQMLKVAGIETEMQLRELGAVVAYHKVCQAGVKPSLNLLYALEGALSDEDWKDVARTRKLSLLLQLEEMSQ